MPLAVVDADLRSTIKYSHTSLLDMAVSTRTEIEFIQFELYDRFS